MQTYEIIVSGRAVHANSADTTLVRTSIGIDKIHVLFDNTEWTAFPVRVTFANGDTIISTSLTLTEIDAPEWAAEAECAIPWEVIQDLGGIRITFQGTDASGNHIITEASGEPLSVVEAGDVGSGTVPSPAPSVDEWNQAYANAMAAANSASGAAESATEAADRANTAAADAEQILEDGIPLMDADTRGGAKLGDGLEVDENEALNAKVGGDITIDGDGAISYELPIMSATQHGGATLGSGLRVDDGALSIGDLVQSGSGEEVATDGCAIYSVDGEGWATQDGTPTPDNPVEIEVCRGRNLLDGESQNVIATSYNPTDAKPVGANAIWKGLAYDGYMRPSNISVWSFADGVLQATVVNSTGYGVGIGAEVEPSTGYCVSFTALANASIRITQLDGDGKYVAHSTSVNNSPFVFTTDASTRYVVALMVPSAINTAGSVTDLQLELGTTPTPYVPYGCVGLEVTHDGTTTVTPIPLPAKGFAASLPDGTADALTVDSAGRWEWRCPTNEVVIDEDNLPSFNASNSIASKAVADKLNTGTTMLTNFMSDHFISGTSVGRIYSYYANIYMKMHAAITSQAECDAFFTANPVTVLYPLATPTTEHGYIDLPALPSGATVSIPELEQIGCAWFVDGCEPIVEHISNERKRTEEALSDVYEAIADL